MKRALVLVLLALAACGPRKDALVVPPELKDDYALFAQRCSKCHSLARPLNAGFTDDEHWILYVNRMRRQPGSGINMEDQEHILRFLHWYAGELRAKKAAKEAPPPPSSAPTAAPPPPPPSDDGGAP